MKDGGVSFLLSMILPDEERRARVLSFLANPDSGRSFQIWYGTGPNGKTLLARQLVQRICPDLQIVNDVVNMEDSIRSIASGHRAIITTNVLDDYNTDDDVVVHFDQKLDGLQWIDLDAKSVDEEFRALLSAYKR